MKEFLKVLISLFLFKKYTIYNRFYKILFGIIAWIELFLIIYLILK